MRSGASSSSANYLNKRTSRSSLSQSNEVLMLAAAGLLPSGTNSQSESLGASISDLSSEAASEFSDNYMLLNLSNANSLNAHSLKSMGSNHTIITKQNDGATTPNKNASNCYNASKLPVFKKIK